MIPDSFFLLVIHFKDDTDLHIGPYLDFIEASDVAMGNLSCVCFLHNIDPEEIKSISILECIIISDKLEILSERGVIE